MPSYNTTVTNTRTLVTDANVIASLVEAALYKLDRERGGYPTSSVGAAPVEAAGATQCGHLDEHGDPDCTHTRPCPDHDDEPGPDTSTERLALQTDRAARAEAALHKAIKKAATYAAVAARLATEWGNDGLDKTAVKERLAAIDSELWCRNCIRYGQKNVRDGQHTECSFCRSFRADFGLSPDAAIFQARDARGGRIDWGTIERILDRDHPGWRKKRPKKKPAAQGITTQAGAT